MSPANWLAGSPNALWLRIAEALIVVLLVAVALALWRVRRSLWRRESLAPALLVVLAFLLRWMAHAGPGDIRAVINEQGTRRAGWSALIELVFTLLPYRDETIWTINRVLGALSVALLYAAMRRRFADPLAAVGGAALLAVTPLIVRFSAMDTPYIILCAAFLGVLVVFDHYVESGSEGALALALGLMALTMQLRPEAPWLIVPAALLTVGGRLSTAAWRDRSWLHPRLVFYFLLFLAINAIPILWSVKQQIMSLGGGFVLFGSVFGSPWADPEMTPRLLAALVVLGAFCARAGGRQEWLWLVAALIALPLLIPATEWLSGGSVYMGGLAFHTKLPVIVPVSGQYASARYHLPAMYLACGLGGLAIARLLRWLEVRTARRVPATSLAVVAIAAVAAAGRFDLLQRMWTPQREFELFRAGMSHVPAHCRVVTLKDTMDSGFIPFDYLAPGGLLDIQQVLPDPPPTDCLVYYRCGNCYTFDLVPESEWPAFQMHPLCRAIEERFRLQPILEADVPALAFRGEIYARTPLPLGFFRLQDASAPSPPH